MIEEVQKRLGKKVVTELKPFDVFYEAEDYHHRYFERHPNQPYCRIVMSPKVKKFMYHFPDRVRMEEAK